MEEHTVDKNKKAEDEDAIEDEEMKTAEQLEREEEEKNKRNQQRVSQQGNTPARSN